MISECEECLEDQKNPFTLRTVNGEFPMTPIKEMELKLGKQMTKILHLDCNNNATEA